MCPSPAISRAPGMRLRSVGHSSSSRARYLLKANLSRCPGLPKALSQGMILICFEDSDYELGNISQLRVFEMCGVAWLSASVLQKEK